MKLSMDELLKDYRASIDLHLTVGVSPNVDNGF